MRAKVALEKVEAESGTSAKVEVKSETIFTTIEVAEKLRTHRYTVYKLLNDGKLKGFRVSNQWRVTSAELERFMATSD